MIEYAHRLNARTHETSIFWLHASTVARFYASYASIATELQLPGSNDPKVDQLGLVRRWLASASSGPWLLIVDNIDDVRLVKRDHGKENVPMSEFYLPMWLPQRANSAVLITSRDRHVAFCLLNHADCILHVENMTSTEAVKLLDTKLTEDKGLSGDKALLAETLEYIPLAMTQAAAYIARRQRITIPVYISILENNQESRSALLAEDNNDQRRDYEVQNSVLKTWQLSFDQIRTTNPIAAQLLSMMCMLDRSQIPDILLRQGSTIKRSEHEAALETLLGYSLIHQGIDKCNFNMHRLVQVATREWLRLDGKLKQQNEAALRTLAEVYPKGEFEDWETCRMFEPHAQAVLENSQMNSGADRFRAELLQNRARFSQLQGEYVKAGDLARESLRERQLFLKHDDIDVLASSAILASALQDQGRFEEAEDMSRRTLADRERVLGLKHADTLTSTNDHARVLHNLGQYEEAEKMHRRALADREMTLGAEHKDTLTSVNNLAWVLQDQGKYDAAEEMHRRALAGRVKAYGPEHPDTLVSLNNLACMLQDRGMYLEAEATHH